MLSISSPAENPGKQIDQVSLWRYVHAADAQPSHHQLRFLTQSGLPKHEFQIGDAFELH